MSCILIYRKMKEDKLFFTFYPITPDEINKSSVLCAIYWNDEADYGGSFPVGQTSYSNFPKGF